MERNDGSDDAANRHSGDLTFPHIIRSTKPTADSHRDNGSVRRWVSRRLERIFFIRGTGTMGIYTGYPAQFHGDKHQPLDERFDPAGCGDLSIHAAQEGLPDQVPLTARIFSGRVARWQHRGIFTGAAPWRLLCRMLLGSHGYSVRGRRHEPRVDGPPYGLLAWGRSCIRPLAGELYLGCDPHRLGNVARRDAVAMNSFEKDGVDKGLGAVIAAA